MGEWSGIHTWETAGEDVNQWEHSLRLIMAWKTKEEEQW